MKNILSVFKSKKILPFVISVIVLLTVLFMIFNIPKKNVEKIVDSGVLTAKISAVPFANSFVKLKETGDIYFRAKDGKRYVMVTEEVFKSWFNDTVEIPEQTIKEMEQSPLGGQLSVRPGTLLTTETDPNIYIALGGKDIKKITAEQVLKYYGEKSSLFKIDLANYYFTAYTVTGEFADSDISTIAANQTPENCLITH